LKFLYLRVRVCTPGSIINFLSNEDTSLLAAGFFIWFYHGLDSAQKLIFENIPFSISAVTYIELLQGVRNKDELKRLTGDLRQWSTTILHVTQNISEHAVVLVEQYALSHNLELADSLIAASTIEYNEVLFSGNSKHYSYIPNMRVTRFYP
jgi:predicted nucleic acid-binding protein